MAFAANAYVQHFTRALFFDSQVPRSYLEMIFCALAGALAATVVASAPLAAVFRRHAWLAAVAVSTPVLALRLTEFFTYTGAISSQVKVMAIVEASSYFALLVLGAWFVSRIWPRPNSSFKPTPLRGAA
ncbi:hypothetical protein [Luteimonas saliphila]|uniref:hypothetical protein n=1 Tax=Luteimonas saliphila TaxID=2804919 RepID=UPI00192D1E37|nr:hypothetical protein [Luteimonas saliphila]